MQSDGCFILVYLGVLSLPITVICCRYGLSDSSKVQGHIVEWCNMITVPWWWESTTGFKVLKLCTLECNLVLASAGWHRFQGECKWLLGKVIMVRPMYMIGSMYQSLWFLAWENFWVLPVFQYFAWFVHKQRLKKKPISFPSAHLLAVQINLFKWAIV